MYKIIRCSTNRKLCKLGNTYAISILVLSTQSKISKKRYSLHKIFYVRTHISTYQ